MPSVALSVFGPASNGPVPGPGARPQMLSVGDSLMWGQGLNPDHRFRELVRRRLDRAAGAVVELSMARSGAQLDPANPASDPATGNEDFRIARTLLVNPPPADVYAASAFTREVPHGSLTTAKQLEVAHELLASDPNGDPRDIRWIILDGGINDLDVTNIITPAGAIADGEILEGWSAWLLERARHEVEPQMVTTLTQALRAFPNAAIVVNGYFPIFSVASMANSVRVMSFGVLNGGLNAILMNPASLLAMAEASRVWQVVSNEHLRRAITRARQQFPGRTVAFARSHIEDSHCLFAPLTWLWGYQGPLPALVPNTGSEWIQWLAGAMPEDEVINQRFARCGALAPGADGFKCRLASIGHPNLAGANDYASAIIEAFEDSGVLASDLDACSLQQRRRLKACVEAQDARDYDCVARNAQMQRTCGQLLKGLGDRARKQAKHVGGDFGRAIDYMKGAERCLQNALGTMAQLARDQFSAAANDIDNAGRQLREALTCWNEADAELRACEDTEAEDVAACDAAYTAAANGPCNIWCNSFGNCNSYGRFNPYRYVCRGLRAACVAAAAAARGVCTAAAAVVREGCRIVAAASGALCKGGVVLGNTVCSIGRGLAAMGDVFLAGARAAVGIATASAAFSEGLACAGYEVSRAGADLGIAGGRIGISVLWDLGLVGAYGVCRGGQWFLDRTCRLVSTGAYGLCRAGDRIVYGACRGLDATRRAIGNGQ
jgi:hypothetical protein